MTSEYELFLRTKRLMAPAVGFEVAPDAIHTSLFPFQRTLTQWAARKGRCGLFEDAGLGKTRQQIEWARLTGERSLIIAPLGVTSQTVAEGERIGVAVHYTRSGDDLADGVNITNYEMIGHFDARKFGAVVLDESSILAGLTSKTRQQLTEMFADTPYRLCCSATPAPNDIAEIANHAEFLGIMTRADMLAAFFVHDDKGWRLKGHASNEFYRWMASWGMSIRKPSDLGFPDDGYNLPPLSVDPVWVEGEYTRPGEVFSVGLRGIQDRTAVRRQTLAARVAESAAMVNASGEQWIVWRGLLDESRALRTAIPDAVVVEGSDSIDAKIAAIEGFQSGKHRVLVTDGRIHGFGLNLQNCWNQVFVGISDSWQSFYQMVRRSLRFGQLHPVNVRIVLSRAEAEVFENVMRKEREAAAMSEQLIAHIREFERAEIGAASPMLDYNPQVEMKLPDWLRVA